MAIVSRRLTKRKQLRRRCCRVSDVMCFVGLLGIVLMVIENELIFHSVDRRDTIASWSIKLVITISTAVLLGLIIFYHYLDLSLYAVNNGIEDWRVVLSFNKTVLIALELFFCTIHPFPRHFPVQHSSEDQTTDSTSTPVPSSLYYIPLDVALGLPMFLRLYLLCRYIVFHSHLVQDTLSQSLGYLNQITMDFGFVIKTYAEQWPTRCIVIFCTIAFFVGSWSMRACDFKPTGEHMSMSDAMWLFFVTFATVGYGDLIPSTYCGR
ncbi:unnamed protein product, partial [Didymodactylos carnosus]